ncbi:restriction endonuclease subunit S [Pannonibacter indicus]|uniref:restriction endonuclease subunit S n=1 Tax=Pannonibacter indicus TaxID=466044 RepID=UPI0035B0066A
MSELPKGWVESAVDEVGDISSGFGFPDRFQGNVAGELPFAKVRDISQAYQKNGGILSGAGNYVSRADLTALKARTVPAGSVAFAKIGEALKLNRRVLLDVEAVLDNNCMAVTPHQGLVEPKFLYRFLTTLDFAPFSVATTVPSIRKGDVGSIRLPLPPLAEQKRIVAKLEALNAKSARARTELARIETLVSRYKQAVLSKAFSAVDAERIALLKLTEFVTSGSRGWAKFYSDEGPLFLRIGNTVRGTIVPDMNDIQRVNPPEGAEGVRTRVQPSDIVVTITADLGRIALIDEQIGEAYVNQHLALVRLLEQGSAAFLAWYLVSDEGQAQLQRNNRGATRSGLGLDDIRQVEVPTPPLEEQHDIVRRIESAFARIDRLAAEAKRALALVGRLDEAVLAKAFRGELVPQDENDEPAATLLARIRAEREAAPKVTRGRKARS